MAEVVVGRGPRAEGLLFLLTLSLCGQVGVGAEQGSGKGCPACAQLNQWRCARRQERSPEVWKGFYWGCSEPLTVLQ